MKNRAFALIELLVVIEILVILVGILLPTLSKAKSAAHRIACVNNQRQIRIARHLYTTDHKGFQVPAWQLNNVNPPLVSGHVLWTAVFWDSYLDRNIKIFGGTVERRVSRVLLEFRNRILSLGDLVIN